MKLKTWNYIHQSTRNSMRHTKNTVELGSRLRRLRDIGQKHPKTPKNVQKRPKTMKLKIWNYIHQSTRNSMRNAKNTVELGSRLRRLRDIGQKRPETPQNDQKRSKTKKLKIWNYIHQSTRNSMRNAKNTLELGSRLRRLRDIGQKRPKTPKNAT